MPQDWKESTNADSLHTSLASDKLPRHPTQSKDVLLEEQAQAEISQANGETYVLAQIRRETAPPDSQASQGDSAFQPSLE